MDLLIIAGFLGAGKTSLLLELVEYLADGGARKIAIIENEIGAVGVDDQMLAAEGLPVREIYSGCICCSLRGDLITTLLELERKESPDLVILEPSGAAGVRQVQSALVGYGGEIRSRHTLCLLDAPRLGRLETIMLPFITNGIEAADLILMNKIDAVSEAQAQELSADVQKIRADAPLLRTSTVDKTGLDELRQWLDDRLGQPATSPTPAPASEASADDERPEGATVWSCTMSLEFDSRPFAPDLAGRMERFVAELQRAGCTLIGHVKCIAKSPGAGWVVVSLTDMDQPASVRGKFASSTRSAELTVNAIVFGVESQEIQDALSVAMKGLE
jgi:G3E family GTPase